MRVANKAADDKFSRRRDAGRGGPAGDLSAWLLQTGPAPLPVESISNMAAGVDWKRHPLYGQGKGKVTDVQTICRILNIAQVDTVLQTVLVKISLNLYWLDERLAERERDQPGLPLPDDLWGPWPELANAVGDGFSVQLLAKGFHDRELGQMNQIIGATWRSLFSPSIISHRLPSTAFLPPVPGTLPTRGVQPTPSPCGNC